MPAVHEMGLSLARRGSEHPVADQDGQDDQDDRSGRGGESTRDGDQSLPDRLTISGYKSGLRGGGPSSVGEVEHLLAEEHERLGEERVPERAEDVPTADEPVAVVDGVEVAARRTHVVV